MAAPLSSLNPLTLKKIGELPLATAADVALVFRRAREAAQRWRATPLRERRKFLNRVRRQLLAEQESVARLITQEIGKPILQSYLAEIFPALYSLRYLIRHASKWLAARPEKEPWFLPAVNAEVVFEPFGVVAILGTWNYPLMLNLSTATEALIAGNAVVYKPSEWAPLVAQKIESLFRLAGLPEGVFQVVYGGAEVGNAVVEGEADKFFFTGSVAVGRQVYRRLAERGKPCVLELSGNDPLIVREDAPLRLAARAAAWGSMLHAGQNCIGTKRILVHRSVAAKFEALLVQEMQALKIGSPEEWETHIGPLRREKELLRCEELVRDAVQKGAHVLIGGKRAHLPYPGHFFLPTLLKGIKPEMKVWGEDFFGPIALLESFDTDEEALAKANSVSFGLSAAIFSKNVRQAEKMAAAIRCGMVTINEVVWPVALPMFPFGGAKASGFGRMRGLEGLREMVNVKTVFARSPRNRFRPYYFQSGKKYYSSIPKWISFLMK